MTKTKYIIVLRFRAPPFEGLGATYDDHLMLIGKRVVDFILVLIELFRYVLWLRRYERTSVESRRFCSNGGQLTENFRYKGSPTNHSFPQKTRLNALSYGVKICTDLSYILSQFTRLTDRRTDRPTDRILIARMRLHSMRFSFEMSTFETNGLGESKNPIMGFYFRHLQISWVETVSLETNRWRSGVGHKVCSHFNFTLS